MPEVIRPDVSLHYEISGNGPPLVMVAGFMSDSASWAPLLPLLEPKFTLIRPDNRTTGRTQPWNAPASMTLWAEDLIAILDDLSLPQAHFVGHSLGGNIGWTAATMAPDRVASLMAIGSAPIGMMRNFDLFRTLVNIRRSDAPQDTWLRCLFPWLFNEDTYRAEGAVDAAIQASLGYPFAQSADAMDWQIDAILGTDPSVFANPPKVPFHTILSRGDLLVPLDRALASLEGTDVTILDSPGHSIHWDAPETVAAHILDFAERHPIAH